MTELACIRFEKDKNRIKKINYRYYQGKEKVLTLFQKLTARKYLLKLDVLLLDFWQNFRRWEGYYSKWKQGEVTAQCFMKSVGLKRTTFFKLVKIYEGKAT